MAFKVRRRRRIWNNVELVAVCVCVCVCVRVCVCVCVHVSQCIRERQRERVEVTVQARCCSVNVQPEVNQITVMQRENSRVI